MKDETLLPCPFCGSPAEHYPDGDMEGYSIMCSHQKGPCNMWAFGYETPEEAERAWNTRDALQSGNSAQPVTVPDGYVLVSADFIDTVKQAFKEVGDRKSFPGHAHDVPGVWDSDNGEKANKPCAQCAMWSKLHDMLAAAPKSSHFRENANSSTELFREIGETSTKCWCRTCRPVTMNDMRFVVCPDCGNKRCPKANDHRNACTGSNEPGQPGSAYPDAPKVPGSQLTPTTEDRLQKAIVDSCMVFLHGCGSLSKNYECDFSDSETELYFCIADVAKKIGVVEEAGNRRWSLSQQMKEEINGVYRKYAMRIMEAAPKVKP